MKDYRNVVAEPGVFTDLMAKETTDAIRQMCVLQYIDKKYIGYSVRILRPMVLERAPGSERVFEAPIMRGADVLTSFYLSDYLHDFEHIKLLAGFVPHLIYTEEEAVARTEWAVIAQWDSRAEDNTYKIAKDGLGFPLICNQYIALKVRVTFKQPPGVYKIRMGAWEDCLDTKSRLEVVRESIMTTPLEFTGTDWQVADGGVRWANIRGHWEKRARMVYFNAATGEKHSFRPPPHPLHDNTGTHT